MPTSRVFRAWAKPKKNDLVVKLVEGFGAPKLDFWGLIGNW